jgi:hypothetical protein
VLAVFDLDGVVIDSVEIIRRCYRECGVEPPVNILELEGVDWITAQGRHRDEVRANKNVLYLEALADGRAHLLPGYDAALALRVHGITSIITTNAPRGTTTALRKALGNDAWPFLLSIEAISTTERFALLARTEPATVYVDDQNKFKMMLPVGWTFVHYTGQNASQLTREIMACISA